MVWTQLDAAEQAATPSDSNNSPPAQISFYNILHPNQGSNNAYQDHFRDELRKLQIDSLLAPADVTGPTPNKIGSISNVQLNGQINDRQMYPPVANQDSTQITFGPSANQPPKSADSAQESHFHEGLRNWAPHNIEAGAYSALGTFLLRTKSEGLVGKAFLNGLAVNGVISAVNLGLDSIFPSVAGHRLFETTAPEAIGIGLAAGLPISDLRIKAGVIGAAWLSGRVFDYFVK
jgi:hypothetical protein